MLERLKGFRLTKQRETEPLVNGEYKKALATVITDFLAKGLLGEHELRVLPNIETQTAGSLKGYISGSLFGFSGEIDGSSLSQPSVRFAWVTNNNQRELVISEIASDKLVFRQKSGTEGPNIKFQLNTTNFLKLYQIEKTPGFQIEVISHPHPNDYLRGDNLQVAVIRVNEAHFSQLHGFSTKQLSSGER